MEISANPRKTLSVRRLGPVDITALRSAVLEIPESVWNLENDSKPNRFEALSSTRHIVFRFVSDVRDWRTSYDRPLWRQWKPLIAPVLRQATFAYGYRRGEHPRIMLARMAPGGKILPHRDSNPAAKWPHKIHVPLLTNDQVTFRIGGTAHHFPEGEAVELNNMGEHAVTNAGETDRIHLIFEYFDLDQPEPLWIRALQPQKSA